MLAGIGYRAECVADGREAVAAYRRAREAGNPFDAVLLDLTVPGGMGGEETLRELRGVDPAVCAIVSSGYSHDRVMAAFREYGFRGMVSKPYRLQDLAAAMASALESPPPPAGEGGAYSHPGAPQG